MAQPTASDVHVDAILTNISIAYRQSEMNYIATQVFPLVPVDKQSDKYFVFTKNDWFRDQAQKRAPGTESAGSGYGLSTSTYYADVFALHKDIDDQIRANSDNPLDPDRNATQWLTQQMLIRQDRQFMTDAFTTGVWGTDLTPANLWDNYTTSDPITDIETAKGTILANTGFLPNTLVLQYNVFRYLKHHPDLVDRIKYTSAKTITPEVLGAIFEIPRVLVSQAVYASNNEGETAAYAFTAGKHAGLFYVNPSPALEMPSAGYTIAWKGVSGNLGLPSAVSRFRMPQLKADRVEIEAAFDNKIVATDLGYMLASVIS